MIAKIIPATKGRTAAAVVGYVTDQQKAGQQQPVMGPDGLQRLMEYVVDVAHDGDKVEWYRVTNCAVDDPMLAAREMAGIQRQNTRVAEEDKTLHIVVSFPEGERPTDAQIRAIEDGLMAALDMTDHQRVSALHVNTDNVHLHLAVNRIHPETLRANEMKFSKKKLMAECERLEIRFGLARVEHGLSKAETARIHKQTSPLTFEEWIRDDAGKALLGAIEEGATWERLHAVAAAYGLELAEKSNGLVIVDAADPTLSVKGSAIDKGLSMRAVSAVVGPFAPRTANGTAPTVTWSQMRPAEGATQTHTPSMPDRQPDPSEIAVPELPTHSGQQSFAEWIKEKAGAELAAAAAPGNTWADVHAVAAKYGVVIKPRGAGLVIADIADEHRATKASAVHRSLAMKALTAALGPYEPPPAEAQRPEVTWEEDTAPDVPEPPPPAFTETELNALPADERAAAIEAHPEVIFNAIVSKSATWTEAGMRKEIRRHLRHLDKAERLAVEDQLYEAIRTSPLLVTTGSEEGRTLRYSTAEFVGLEQHMMVRARGMSAKDGPAVTAEQVDAAIVAFEQAAKARLNDPGFTLADQQRAAVHHVVAPGSLKLVLGQAGTGKSTILDSARMAWEGGGYAVIGTALSGIAAENLEASGIKSRTIASLLASLERRDRLQEFAETGVLTPEIRDELIAHADDAIERGSQWAVTMRQELETGALSEGSLDWAIQWAERRLERRRGLDEKTVLVVDEAGMVDSRQMTDIIRRTEAAGAKLVLVGDSRQLQPIQAGAAFRAMAREFGYAELTDIRRQTAAWQRHATSLLATGKVHKGIMEYAKRGSIVAGIDMDEAAFVITLEGKLGIPLDSADRGRVVTIARYAEARNAAGALWSVIRDADDPKKHEWYEEFQEWKTVREEAAQNIAADIDAYRPWLARFGVNGEGLPADILAASGNHTRDEAIAEAPEHALSIGVFEIEETHPEEDRLKADFRTGAKAALVAGWADAVQRAPDATRIILAHSRADVADMNIVARRHAREIGRLTGPDYTIATNSGEQTFAIGDRLLFLENNKGLGVKNGTTGTITAIATADGDTPQLSVTLDDGRHVVVDPGSYTAFDLGYAATVHKSQGITVDEAYVLGTAGVDAHLAYVSMSRHRAAVRVYTAAGDAAKPEIFAAIAAQANSQDSTLDHPFAKQPLPEPPAHQQPRRRAAAHPSRRPRRPPLPDDARVESLAEHPEAIFNAINEHSATWTEADMRREVRQYLYHLDKADRAAAEDRLVAGLLKSPLLIATAPEDPATTDQPSTTPRYTTKAFAALEQRMMATAARLANTPDSGIDSPRTAAAITSFEAKAGFPLTNEQKAAVHHVTAPGLLASILGQAGTGKSTILKAARIAWEEAEYTVIGTALSGIAAENLQQSGIKSRTIASLIQALDRRDQLLEFLETGVVTDDIRDALMDYADWKIANGKPEAVTFARFVKSELDANALSPASLQWATEWAERRLSRTPGFNEKTVVVVDESGMVASRQLAEIIHRIDEAGAKLVLVGDPQQLQPIQAGAAFRAITERFGYAELTDIRRQKTGWQRTATSALAKGRVEEGITAYTKNGHISAGIDMDEAAFVTTLERHLASAVDPADRARVITIARYAEARNAAGALWSVISGPNANTHEWYDDFEAWKAKREQMAIAIGDDLDAYKPWLARFAINGEGLAADILAATGNTRDEAQAAAPMEAKTRGIFEIEESLPEEDRLKADFRTGAKAALVAAWADATRHNPDATRIILAHSRADTAHMNTVARQFARDHGLLTSEDQSVATADGDRAFAGGDRLLFLENNKSLGVNNGTTGTVIGIDAAEGQGARLSVMLDDGREITVDTQSYNNFDHGYAVTVHKSQGVTVDEAYLLATSGVDAHLAYVSMSRHRFNLRVFAAAGDAAKPEIFAKTAAKANSQDSTLDHNFPTVEQPNDAKKHTATQARERYRAGPKQSHPKSPVLFKVYQAERADNLAARDEHITALREIHDKYRADLGKLYDGERERSNSLVNRLFGRPKQIMFDANRTRHAGLKQSGEELRAGIARIKAAYPLHSWQEWLQNKAEEGNTDALSVLRATAGRHQDAANAITSANSATEALAVVLKGHRVKARHDGRLIYSTADGGVVTDHATMIAITKESHGAAIIAAQLAAERHPGQEININGSPDFRRWMADYAGKADLPIRFADPDDEAQRAAAKGAQAQAPATDTEADKKAKDMAARMRQGGDRTKPATSTRQTILTHKDWTPGLMGEYTFNGISAHGGKPALKWQQGSTVYVQPQSKQALAAVKDMKPGTRVTFDVSGQPKPTAPKHGRTR